MADRPRRPNPAHVLFDAVAADYDRTGVEFFAPIGRRLVRLSSVSPGECVLDIGCGRGAALFPAARAAGPTGSVTGLDLAAAMVEATNADARRAGHTHVRAIVMDGGQPSFPGGSFDVITGSMSVHMLPDPASAFRAYHRLLRPGGRLGLAVPTSVPEPEPKVFGLGAIARMSAEYGSDSGVYPYGEALGGPRRAREELLAAGFSTVDIRHEQACITAPSAIAFLRWTWSHGMRLLWERVPVHQRTRHRKAIADEAHARSLEPDHIVLPVPVTYVVAHRGPRLVPPATAATPEPPPTE
ncbi:class I SAM-dependent methyltransferase [Kitasatospora sp. NPDC056783]|uniref:class I SAM-dependent methyltransferase n=1 Tax=Kitasatospora sp. NPDC056783 TaxID=3345943 RepID=UPI0036BD9E4C